MRTNSTAVAVPPSTDLPEVFGGPWNVTQSLAYCEDTVAHQDLSSLPIAIKFLDRDLRCHLASILAFTLAVNKPGITVAELDAWDEGLIGAVRRQAKHPILVALAETIERFSIPVAFFSDVIAAGRMDLKVTRYPTFDALMRYCEKSSNPLGRAVLALARDQDTDHLRCADDVATALRLADFWHRIGADFRRGHIYLPEEDLLRFGVSEADLKQGRMTKQFRDLMQFELSRTRTLMLRGLPLCQRVPKPFRLEFRSLWQAGETLLQAIERRHYRVFGEPIQLSLIEQVRGVSHLLAWQVRDFTQW